MRNSYKIFGKRLNLIGYAKVIRILWGIAYIWVLPATVERQC